MSNGEAVVYGEEAAKLAPEIILVESPLQKYISDILENVPPPPPPPPPRFKARIEGGWKEATDLFFPLKKSHLKALNKMFDENYPFIQPYLKKAHKWWAIFSKDNLKAAVTKEEFLGHYNNLAEELMEEKRRLSNIDDIGGITNKWEGIIYLNPKPFNEEGPQIGAAIHECIHLLANPPGAIIPRSRLGQYTWLKHRGTFRDQYGKNLDEGVTQYFTEVILQYQHFNKWKRKSYEFKLKPLYYLIRYLGKKADQILAKAYFTDEDHLQDVISEVWGMNVLEKWFSEVGKGDKGYKEADKLLRKSPKNKLP